MKKSKSTVSHKGISHGKAVAKGAEMALGPAGSHKGAKGKMKPKVEGHVDHTKLHHDAKGHEKGSRGPFTKASTGKHKSKD